MVETTYKINTPVSLALLSDLHGRDPQNVLCCLRDRMAAGNEIDLIAITGDFIYGSWPVDDKSPLEAQEHVLPFLSGCAEIAPTFVSLGNHEQMLDSSDLATVSATGVTLLDNGFQAIDIHKSDGKEERVIIGGLTSAYVTDYRRAVDTLTASERGFCRYPRKESIQGLKGLTTASERLPDTSWLFKFAAAPGDYHVLLCHHPEYISCVPQGVDLILSGHAHGGQWRIFGHGVFAPGQGFWPQYTKGLYHNRLVISAGLSNTARIPRICNPTEIVYIT